MALRIEAVFGIEMETLMGMQCQFDIAEARKHLPHIRNELAAKARAPVPASVLQEEAPMLTIVRRGAPLA